MLGSQWGAWITVGVVNGVKDGHNETSRPTGLLGTLLFSSPDMVFNHRPGPSGRPVARL